MEAKSNNIGRSQHTPNIYYRDEVVEGGRLSLFFPIMQPLLLYMILFVKLTLLPYSLLFLPYNNGAHLHNSWVRIVVAIHA